jgi:PadR family transcriptional regulator PadR
VNAQMLKGLLEGCILQVIRGRETYGYRICEDLAGGGFADVNEGTVYPILIRLEKRGFIRAKRKESPLGPMRKYYRLTPEGEEYLAAFTQSWEKTSQAVNRFLKGGS